MNLPNDFFFWRGCWADFRAYLPTNFFFFEGAVEQIGTKVASSFQAWLKASFNLKLLKNILKEIGPALLFQGDPLHALAGGDICFAPDLLGNGDEEVVHDRSDHLTKYRTFEMCLYKMIITIIIIMLYLIIIWPDVPLQNWWLQQKPRNCKSLLGPPPNSWVSCLFSLHASCQPQIQKSFLNCVSQT